MVPNRQQGKTETQEFSAEDQKTLFPLRVTEVTRRGWGLFISGGIQKPSGHGPSQLTPGDRP